MCTLTHFTRPLAPASTPYPAGFQHSELSPQAAATPRFQVVLAGNAFFHIKEISTGQVRGFRSDHNEACALARKFELHR